MNGFADFFHYAFTTWPLSRLGAYRAFIGRRSGAGSTSVDEHPGGGNPHVPLAGERA